MPIMMVFEMPTMDQAQYDAVMQALGFDKKPNWPKGFISHAAGAGPNGWVVVDLWESEADFGAFQQNQLGPAFQKAGITGEPKVFQVPVYYRYPAAASKAKPAAGKKTVAKKKKKK